ncbi:MAG: ComF family protein [Aureispira sp.]
MTVYQALRAPLDSLLALLYPELCLACHQSLAPSDSVLCLRCQYHIAPTNYHLQTPNPVLDRFWGRIEVEHACTGFIFNKGSALQQLVHELKYNNQQQVGIELGQQCGELLQDTAPYTSVDCIIPVPLHPKKLRQRGYNQATLFAQGISTVLQKPCLEQHLIRSKYTTTQTKKSRLERLANVEEAFAVEQQEALQHQHILLVDDVITTGATLEACAHKLLAIEGVRVSIAAIALAN